MTCPICYKVLGPGEVITLHSVTDTTNFVLTHLRPKSKNHSGGPSFTIYDQRLSCYCAQYFDYTKAQEMMAFACES